MEKRYYTAASLKARLRGYEVRYGVSTEELLRRIGRDLPSRQAR